MLPITRPSAQCHRVIASTTKHSQGCVEACHWAGGRYLEQGDEVMEQGKVAIMLHSQELKVEALDGAVQIQGGVGAGQDMGM